MKKLFIVFFIVMCFIGCKEDLFNEKDYVYKTTVMESADGRIKVTFQYNEEYEIKYLDLYWDAIMTFEDNINDVYEQYINRSTSVFNCDEENNCVRVIQ